jgi:hypothetical protein
MTPLRVLHNFSTRPQIISITDATAPLLLPQAHDIDQEIKEAAISTMGVVVAHLADHMDASQLATIVLVRHLLLDHRASTVPSTRPPC